MYYFHYGIQDMIQTTIKRTNKTTIVLAIDSDEDAETEIDDIVMRLYNEYALHPKVLDATYWKDIRIAAVTLHMTSVLDTDFMMRDIAYRQDYIAGGS